MIGEEVGYSLTQVWLLSEYGRFFMEYKILVCARLHASAHQAFARIEGAQVRYAPDLRGEELQRAVKDIDVLVTRSGTAVDATLMDAASQLKVVARAGVGIGNIDLAYATDKGILVVNVPGKNTTSAAEITAALMLSMARALPQAYIEMKGGGWNRDAYCGVELSGKTIGIVGLGNVGSKMAQICRGLGMNVHAHDPYLSPQIFLKRGVVREKTLASLLEIGDVVSLHVPLNQETRHMMTAKELQSMKKGSFLLNTARGGVVKEEDLLELLECGHIRGCGIDTWQDEPQPWQKLVQHPRVFCTPHIGAITEEAQIAVGVGVAEQVHKALTAQVVDYPVNFPKLSSDLRPGGEALMVLAEKIGSLAVQIASFHPYKVVFRPPQGLSEKELSVVEVALQKGYLTRISDTFVSYANAQALFAAQGLELSTTYADESGADVPLHGENTLQVILYGSRHREIIICGTVYDHKFPRITYLNNFRFEVEPKGSFIVFKNQDKPGVVGAVGMFLARQHLNIDSLYLSANKQGGMAMAMVKLSAPISSEHLQMFRDLPLIEQANAVEL